jgi:hypothetical protein
MNKHLLSTTLKGLSAAVLLAAGSMVYAQNAATYTGQGLNSNADGFGGYDLNLELCGVANGADAEGPYLLWVFTSQNSSSATIIGPWGTAAMTKTSTKGTFKYVSGWYDPNTLLPNVVSASGDGKKKNAQLTVSHGCRPFTTEGAWCSPGYWRNSSDAAWTLVGRSKTELFNATVYDAWYGATFVADPTLGTVLGDAPTYSGPTLAGTSGYALNAFNATGAFLTNNIPGFAFDWNVMQAGGSNACPIDSHGNFKNP